MKYEKGSITIFSVLSLLLVTATVFALLEATRLQEIRRFAGLRTEAAIESLFANYNRYLWQEYRLLGMNGTQADEVLDKVTNVSVEGNNLLRMKEEEKEISGYTYITDGNGSVFIQSVSTYIQENLVYEIGKQLYSQYESIKDIMDTSEMDISDIGEALDGIENADKLEKSSSFGTSGKKSDAKGILETAKSLQNVGILELVVEDTDKLSDKEEDFSNGLLKRTLQKGEAAIADSISSTDKVLFTQYLQTYLSNFQDVQENRALSYELEYLLGRKNSDIKNLKAVANKLLAIREAANFVYLLSNPTKMMQAEALATSLAGVSLNPALIQVVKIGLLTAWAFAESILDVRALLAGRKVALVKSEATWTIGLENMYELTNDFAMAKESEWGLDYQNYLGILLLLENEETLAMHTMNLQEATIRKNSQDTSFGMDTLMVQASLDILYSYQPVFPFLRLIDAEERWERKITSTRMYGYY